MGKEYMRWIGLREMPKTVSSEDGPSDVLRTRKPPLAEMQGGVMLRENIG